MKKLLMSMLLVVLVVAACGNDANNNNDAVQNNADNNQAVSNNNDGNKNDAETNDSSKSKNDTNSDNASSEDGNEQENQATENDEDESDDKSVEEQLKELSRTIFAAQRDEDYDYLESMLVDAGSIDKDGKVFHVEGEYEDDIDFVQEPDDNFEYRYVHESDDHTVFVGYGITDYETESSYTIDFEFVQLDGEWKMQSMDKNA